MEVNYIPKSQQHPPTTMQISISLLSLLLIAAPVLAADCAGGDWALPEMQPFWSARDAACNSGGKYYSNNQVEINYIGPCNAVPPAQLCWDTVSNIMSQCTSAGKLSKLSIVVAFRRCTSSDIISRKAAGVLCLGGIHLSCGEEVLETAAYWRDVPQWKERADTRIGMLF